MLATHGDPGVGVALTADPERLPLLDGIGVACRHQLSQRHLFADHANTLLEHPFVSNTCSIDGRAVGTWYPGVVRIEEYALIGDTQTAGLVSTAGSIDWLCLPRFDSGACFAALLGDDRHGRWRLAPAGQVTRCERRYRRGTLVLETEMATEEGVVRLVECMPIRDRTPDVVRLVEGVRGTVPMRMELVLRFGYGTIVPWVHQVGSHLRAVAGPDSVELVTPVPTSGEDYRTVADFTVGAGDVVPFALRWHPSHELPPPDLDPLAAVADTTAWWEDWTAAGHIGVPHETWRAAVERSLITLKALTYAPSGGIVAAPTTSLPEKIGGVRNWDYRYCWLRDATFTLDSLMLAGYIAEAKAWRDWLVRAVAGEPSKLQIMYGPAGERRLTEYELPDLPGYEGSEPVRIGNAASGQFQLDVYGEVMDAMHQGRRAGVAEETFGWALQCALMDYLESAWKEPDEGIWEVRGPRRHFTHSKVMAWVAADRAVQAVARFGNDGPADRWRALRSDIFDEVCAKGFDTERNTFTQYFGSKDVDAALLMIPLVGFLPADDSRMQGTLAAVERELTTPEGFVRRYVGEDSDEVDGLPPGEGAFLACTFWLADNLALAGRQHDAEALFDRLLTLRNDVGLLAEEYDPVAQRLVGNFPQAFSHVSLVNTAYNLSAGVAGPARAREAGSSGASGRLPSEV
jgi:GH15 family glucan-1,4-alpha-glucosidase